MIEARENAPCPERNPALPGREPGNAPHLSGHSISGTCRLRRLEEIIMSTSSRIRFSALATAAAILTFMAATPASAYALICKHGKYDIDSRDEAQLKSAFGTSYCTMRRFSYRSDAENFSKSNNMQVGKSCSCR
jgi:hypothetical protein